jgi:hypothetical protein
MEILPSPPVDIRSSANIGLLGASVRIDPSGAIAFTSPKMTKTWPTGPV